MELIDKQRYMGWSLPKDSHIILTTNPDDGNYQVNAIDDAQKTRFISIHMKWDAECWAEWAETVGVDGRCINFVLHNPEIVSPLVNPRAITKFFDSISSIKQFEDSLPLISMIGEGSIGNEASNLFTMFINNRLDKLITPKELLQGADDATVFKKLEDAVGTTDKYRADIASILTTRLINYSLLFASENTVEQKHITRLINLIKEPTLLTNDLKYHLVKKLVVGNKQKFQKFLNDPVVQDYVLK